MDSSIHLLAGRPHGGLGVLWRKSLGDKCNIVDLDDTRLLCMEIAIKHNDDEIKLLFVNIYMHIISGSICLELMIFLNICVRYWGL